MTLEQAPDPENAYKWGAVPVPSPSCDPGQYGRADMLVWFLPLQQVYGELAEAPSPILPGVINMHLNQPTCPK